MHARNSFKNKIFWKRIIKKPLKSYLQYKNPWFIFFFFNFSYIVLVFSKELLNFPISLPLRQSFSFEREKSTWEWSVEIAVNIYVIVTNFCRVFEMKIKSIVHCMKPEECFCAKLNHIDFVFLTLHISHLS